MDDLSPLFQDIAFTERFRGYDVAEVDAYIDRVAKAAALVQGRIAELQSRVEAAEAHGAGSVDTDPVEVGEESLTKMLLLAQRTADAAIEEAHAEAAE
ncbi:MAG: DivIVA domain-containing protein, partial [Acidimicrobiaceae bacterium]